MFECANCGSRSVYWQVDYSFEDVGSPGEGIVQIFECDNCGAHIEYWIDLNPEEES